MTALIASEADEASYRRCAGVMLVNGLGRVWVGEREDLPGAWQMPQGGIDAGEDPHSAALRELEEETSVSNVAFLAEAPDWFKYELPPELKARAWNGRWRGQMQKWFALRHLGPDSEIDVRGVDSPEFARWQWVDIDEVPRLIVDFKRPVYAAVVEAFRPHIS
ncbi:MAG: RNA pyrophosphohydrolase [Rhodospirillaceae bacterium]|nr:RNA pyrophosphohydrolase [Rhodospirillaceae bacterium]|tara:strand:+ start:538 stop:1026 length:489 start_codon:yes stop_codon:yes gene_type:complete